VLRYTFNGAKHIPTENSSQRVRLETCIHLCYYNNAY